ncbi:MAG: formyltransferase family protein, partial [Bacillota bacterium]|nr:formyltransferase family protein [Bacillota bacterium]
FLRILSPEVPLAFPQRMLNIHPALLPSFGGKGMYGHYVHQAVLASGTQFTGATVHFVTEETDVGPIILQRTVPVLMDDDEDSLANRVLQIEHEIYPLALQKVAEEKVEVYGLRVRFLD